MTSIILRPFYYRKNEQIRFDLENDPELYKVLENIKGMIWSNTKQCWYILLTKKNLSSSLEALNNKAIVDTTFLDTYLLNRKKIKKRFDLLVFFIALVFIMGLAAGAHEIYSQRDAGIYSKNFFINLLGDSFMVWRFPLLTIFWGHFGGIKDWTTVMAYLLVNCMMYAFIIERMITLLRPNKKLVENALLSGELQI
jgi:hypothetical protein